MIEHGPYLHPQSGTLPLRYIQARGYPTRYEHDRAQRQAGEAIAASARRAASQRDRM